MRAHWWQTMRRAGAIALAVALACLTGTAAAVTGEEQRDALDLIAS
jgi:hypothetical protein